jgi:hypothetical protein
MAARQDQTLQIFLIVFIFLFLVSAVVAYLGWRGYSEAEQRATSLQTELNNKNTQVQTQQTELEDMREMTGFGRGDNTADVKKAAKDELKPVQGRAVNYSAGVAYEPVAQWASEGETEEHIPPYRVVLQAVYNDAQQAAAREAALKEQLSQTQKAMEALEDQTEAKVKAAEDAKNKVEADFAAARNSFQQDRDRMAQTEKELMAKVESQKTEFEAKLAKYEADKQAMQKVVADLEHAVEVFKAERQDEPGSFETADGRISWVNQNGTVWINLGTADSLRRQVTFTVFDGDQHDAVKATKKGSIEVTRLLGPHMAEAKITEDDPTNPILTGDQISSHVWHRGKRLHFALTGFIDFDDDGRSDMQLARELIEWNGGIVDAFLNDDGKVEGKITANTRYLVLGDIPESAIQAKLQAGWNEMSQVASQLGVESVTLPEFLIQMGYKPKDRMVQLGSGATARDFPARPESEGPPVTQPRFRARTPYRAPAVETAQ